MFVINKSLKNIAVLTIKHYIDLINIFLCLLNAFCVTFSNFSLVWVNITLLYAYFCIGKKFLKKYYVTSFFVISHQYKKKNNNIPFNIFLYFTTTTMPKHLNITLSNGDALKTKQLRTNASK